MNTLIPAIKLILSALISCTYNSTLLPLNKHHATFVAAATQKLSHQVDNEIGEQLKRFHNQLERIQNIRRKKTTTSRPWPLYDKQLNDIEQVFNTLQADYEQHSPAMVILGPIGAAATVLKEKKITENLYRCMQDLAHTLELLAHPAKEYYVPIVLEKDLNKALDKLDDLIDSIDRTTYQPTKQN
jgi:hypothetical protein